MRARFFETQCRNLGNGQRSGTPRRAPQRPYERMRSQLRRSLSMSDHNHVFCGSRQSVHGLYVVRWKTATYIHGETSRHSRRTDGSGISDAGRPNPCASAGGNVRRFVQTVTLSCVMFAAVSRFGKGNTVNQAYKILIDSL